MPKLTRDNFSIAEMSDCSLAERMGIDNTPDIAVLQNLGVTVTGLERIRSLLGYPVHVNSGYRCEELEKVLCQSDYCTWSSRNGHSIDQHSWADYFNQKVHPTGYAADFTCAQYGSPLDIVRVIQNSSLQFDVCIAEGTGVHISFAPAMRRELMAKTFDHFGVSDTRPYAVEELDADEMVPPPLTSHADNKAGRKVRAVISH
jgi:hypothetical protein